MTDQDQPDQPERRDFQGAVADAAKAVAETKAAQDEAAERQKPRPRGPILVASLVLLVVVGIYDWYVLTRPPEALPDDIVAADLRISVGTLAEEIDLFFAQEGRLPTVADLTADELLDEGVTYAAQDSGYTITATDEVVTVTYESATDLESWIAGGNQ